MMIQAQLDQLLKSATQAISKSADLTALEACRVAYFGKKGQLTAILKQVSHLPVEERPKAGKIVNQIKRQIHDLLHTKKQALQEIALAEQLAEESIDITLPGRGRNVGSLHPVTQVTQRVVQLFTAMGFNVAEGPEIEDDFHNFSALNIPEDHPARDLQDTFYFPDGRLLRTHTSPVQIRVLQEQKPPIRIITPGKVYRCDLDPTHTPMFHQMEALVVAKDCTFAQLKGLVGDFFNRFFGTEIGLRFRPSYFPFTEPSAEVDIQHLLCDGKGCRVCGFSGWLEVLGCGMVHPAVLRNVYIDPTEFSGYAFGLGLDRLTMLWFGVDDIRLLFENDLRFLKQFTQFN